MKAQSPLKILLALLPAAILMHEGIQAAGSGELGWFAGSVGITAACVAALFLVGRFLHQRKGDVWISRFYSVFALVFALMIIAFLAYVRFW